MPGDHRRTIFTGLRTGLPPSRDMVFRRRLQRATSVDIERLNRSIDRLSGNADSNRARRVLSTEPGARRRVRSRERISRCRVDDVRLFRLPLTAEQEQNEEKTGTGGPVPPTGDDAHLHRALPVHGILSRTCPVAAAAPTSHQQPPRPTRSAPAAGPHRKRGQPYLRDQPRHLQRAPFLHHRRRRVPANRFPPRPERNFLLRPARTRNCLPRLRRPGCRCPRPIAPDHRARSRTRIVLPACSRNRRNRDPAQ